MTISNYSSSATLANKFTTRKVAVIQSNYIPWAGYFAIMSAVDVFVVYECVQYTKNDWRNRNQVEGRDGRRTWLSIPIRQLTSTQPFMEVTVSDRNWAHAHYKTLQHFFARCQGWYRWRNDLELLYANAGEMTHLFEINRLFLNWVAAVLGVGTKIVFLEDYPKLTDPNERLVSILEHFGATYYLSGPAAQNYIDSKIFECAGIDLEYVNYDRLIEETLPPLQSKKVSIIQSILENANELKSH